MTEGRAQLIGKIEEAEISFMRTEHIYALVLQYSERVEKKLKGIVDR